MKSIVQIVATLAATLGVVSRAFAQTAQQHVEDATAKAESAIVSTGIPPWAWIVIVAALVVVFALVATRRRRPTQAVIKTRLG